MEPLELENKITALEQRLARVEGALMKAAQAPAAPLPPAVPVPVPPPPPKLQTLLRAQAPAAAPRERSGNWLGIVASICFVFAAAFIIKLSIDSGWLTPERQIGLAVLLGVGLIAAGFALLEADREYSSLLPGAGIIVLYLTVFAAHRLYALITFESAISLISLVSMACVWLYTRIREDWYPVTAALGSYCAPVVLSLGSSSTFSLYYFLLCSTAFASISVWVKSRTLTLVAAYLAIMLTALTGLRLGQNPLIAGMLALNFLVFAAGTYLYTRQYLKPLTESESSSFLPLLLFFYAMEYYYIDRIQPGLAPWLSLGFAGLLLGLYLSARKLFPEAKIGSQGMVFAFVSLVCFHSFYLELMPAVGKPWLFVAIALAAAFSPVRLGDSQKDGPLRIPALAVLAVLLIEYVAMVSHLLSGNDTAWLAVSLASVVSLWALIYARGADFAGKDGHGPLLGAAHLLAVSGLYRLTTETGSLAVSASWLVYAVGVIALAFERKDEVMAKSAMLVLGFAAGKALLYDAASAPTTVRILCLLLTGAALYGSGFLIRRISGWKNEKA
ncbi:MAG: hypothetical protein A2X31_10730 [Elusimicrobia bacterium GWB2_63_22]|nr:MAG: hypothetical protein A2X31_10730 [Elusimicrobia bacterium GWB2_63_22]